jgi:hypothetical protein
MDFRKLDLPYFLASAVEASILELRLPELARVTATDAGPDVT